MDENKDLFEPEQNGQENGEAEAQPGTQPMYADAVGRRDDIYAHSNAQQAEQQNRAEAGTDGQQNAYARQTRWNYTYTDPNAAASGPVYETRRTKKPHRARNGVAWLLVLSILLGAAAGFGGGWAAGKMGTHTALGDQAGESTVTKVEKTVEYLSGEEGLSMVELAEKISPAVVAINTEYTVENYWMQTTTATGAGSGVIISADGTVITNNHVIENANSIKVTLSDGTEYDATLVATDEQSDIAVLKMDATDLPFAEVGDSDQLVVGQSVVAVGNPLGELGGTVTDGIVSALNREVTVEGNQMTLIQTNAAINPGNSGGGLFDAEGKLVGIVNAKASSTGVEGLGFAIPINVAMKSAQDLMDKGYVTGRIRVGVNLLDVDSQQMAFQYRLDRLGVYVYSTESGSSAEKAGLKTGDFILSIDGKEVSTSDDVKSLLAEYEVGDSVTVRVLRNEEEIDLTMILTEYVPTTQTTAN